MISHHQLVLFFQSVIFFLNFKCLIFLIRSAWVIQAPYICRLCECWACLATTSDQTLPCQHSEAESGTISSTRHLWFWQFWYHEIISEYCNKKDYFHSKLAISIQKKTPTCSTGPIFLDFSFLMKKICE